MEGRIQAYLRVAARRGRIVEQVGPFLATISPESSNPYLNYAIPDDGAAPSPDDVAALVVIYGRHGRTPRLEYIPQLAPAVERALLAVGFVAEARTPLMTCAPGDAPDIAAPEGVELLVPTSDAELLALSAAQHEAFGDPPPDATALGRLRAAVAGGQILVLARAATGEAVGGGAATAPADGLSEIGGIGVRPAYRRRGVAPALTARLAREAFAAGVALTFLMAAGEDEARIYGRAGFVRAGEVLHISLPRPGPA